jgi:hypothetical protein
MSRRHQAVERVQRPADDCPPEVLDAWISQVLDRIVNPADPGGGSLPAGPTADP